MITNTNRIKHNLRQSQYNYKKLIILLCKMKQHKYSAFYQFATQIEYRIFTKSFNHFATQNENSISNKKHFINLLRKLKTESLQNHLTASVLKHLII